MADRCTSVPNQRAGTAGGPEGNGPVTGPLAERPPNFEPVETSDRYLFTNGVAASRLLQWGQSRPDGVSDSLHGPSVAPSIVTPEYVQQALVILGTDARLLLLRTEQQRRCGTENPLALCLA